MKKRFLELSVLVLTLAGCASYQKRKQCEKTNWFQHGFGVAMSGNRLSGDTTVLECRKVEAKIDEGQLDVGFKSGMQKYCEPDVVFSTGKKGEFFNTELCFAANAEKLKLRHAEGVAQFCQKSNGFAAGTSGYVYKQICPEKLEKGFLPEYRRGRKKFLMARLENNGTRKSELDREIDSIEQSRQNLERERSHLAGRQTKLRERELDVATGRYIETERWVEDPEVESRRSSLDWSISQKDDDLRTRRKEKDELSSQISKDRIELQGLDDT